MIYFKFYALHKTLYNKVSCLKLNDIHFYEQGQHKTKANIKTVIYY